MDTRSEFDAKLQQRIIERKPNSSLILPSEYEAIISNLKRIEAGGKKANSDYKLLKRYTVKIVGQTEKLVKIGTDLVFVSTNELYDIIQSIHIQLGHAGRNVMFDYLKKRYANVTIESLMDYLNLCETCTKKRKVSSKHVITRPISNDTNSRCQCDLIDMQSQPDGKYRFIMVYQDHVTKFVQLRPLMRKCADEVAYQLKLIFAIFGVPYIFHSNNGHEFENAVIKALLKLWPVCKMAPGKPQYSQNQLESVDVENRLKCWMSDKKTSRWSEGLPEVQMDKNSSFHSGIGCTPFKAMFGTDPKMGLSTMLSANVIDRIETEEDLQIVLEGSPSQVACGLNVDKEHVCHEITCPRMFEEDRHGAKRGLESQVEKMKQASNKRFKPGEVGDTVRIPILEVQ